MDLLDYNLNFLCTYNLLANEKELSSLCYQNQFLQCFNLNSYDSKKIDNIIIKLYNILKDDNEIIDILNILSQKLTIFHFLKENDLDLDKLLIFQILFSYDYFFQFHNSLIHYKTNKSLNNNSFTNLIQLINNK